MTDLYPLLKHRHALFDFVERECLRHRIDTSHGIIHATRCVKWVDVLMAGETHMTPEEKTVATYAAALHDLCDQKYVSIMEAVVTLRRWMIEESNNPDLTDECIDAILSIIQTMSYSFLSQRENADGSHWFPNHGFFSRSYHLVRHADLLEGYHVGRCVLYTKHAYPSLTNEEVWHRVETLFEHRMFRYVSDEWITHPVALEYAPKLEAEARQCFRTKMWEYESD